MADDEKTRALADIDDTRGPLERLLRGSGSKDATQIRSLSPAEGQAELERAQELLDEGDYKTAEQALKKIAKNYPDSPVAEDALFLIAESQFQRQRYPLAQDSYDRLVKHFPSTRYMDRYTRRMFEIAQIWLQEPSVVKATEIAQVDFEDPSKTPPPVDPDPKPRGITRRVPILPNLWDRSRPAFDTEGRALEALRSIWRNDPSGNRADDALMLEASYHLRKGNFTEADHLYKIIREDYGDSPHFQNAFVLGSHVKLMSYQGAAYDPKSLHEAEQLKKSAAHLFPEHPAQERIQAELRKIQQAKVAQLWEDVNFYQSKKNPQAVAIYCRRIVDEYPNSEFAVRARELLSKLNTVPQAKVQIPESKPAPVKKPSTDKEPSTEKRRLFNLFRRNEPKPLPEGPAGRIRLQ